MALTILYVIFALAHPVAEPDLARILTPMSAASAVFFAGLVVVLRRPPRVRSSGHALLLLSAVVMIANSALHLAYSGDARESTNLLLVTIGAGCIALLYSWYLLIIGASLGTWLVIALLSESGDWGHYAFLLLSGAALSVTLFVSRRRAELRILRLRALDHQHRNRLERTVAERTRDLESSRMQLVHQIRESEQAVRRAERLRQALDHAGEAITLLDGKGIVQYGNAAFFEMMNRKPEDLLGQPFDFVRESEEDDQLIDDVSAELARSGSWNGRYKTRWRDGRTFTRFASVNVASTDHGEPLGVVAVLRDVTREAQLEEELLHSQRMEAVGQLAGGIAHDFNNLLMVIQGYADELAGAQGLGAADREDVDAIRRAAQSAGQLTGQLLAFSRKQTLEPGIVDLNSIVEQLRALLCRVIGEDVELEAKLAAGPLEVCVDTGQMEQAITNLAANARDAMPGGGQLEIATSVVERDRERWIQLTVTDTGGGIDECDIERIFEPFFTTKEPGKGTGLGLSMVHGFVNQSGGTISVESRAQGGTTFRILLPEVAREPRVEPDREISPPSEEVIRSARILVVEDDQAVRKMLCHALESAGHQIFQAANGERALELATMHGPTVDIVITDLVMPGMSGLELVDQLRKPCPGARVLLMSGFPSHPSTIDLTKDHELLDKPFSTNELLAKVASLIKPAAPRSGSLS